MSIKNIFPLILGVLFIAVLDCHAQVFNDITRFAINSTPVHGVKIKTSIPFAVTADMPTITLYGLSYGTNESINLQITFYIFTGGNGTYFHEPHVSSAGAYTPRLSLANENGKVVIYIHDQVYYQRFYVNAFSGFNQPTFYQNWEIVDEPLVGEAVANIAYKNSFKGNISLPNGKWTENGDVGIGTATPGERLSVNGKIRAHEIKVETANWPDYVFLPDYDLKPLSEISKFIKENGHLPEVPKAAVVEEEGISLGEMNKILLKKVEELTLHLIEKDRKFSELENRVKVLEVAK